MILSMRSIFVVTAVALTLGAGAFQDQAMQANARLDAYLLAFNSKDKAKMKAAIEANFAPAMFERRKLTDWVAQTYDIANDLSPMTVQEKLLEKPNVAVVAVKVGTGEKLYIRVDCEPKPPHRIIGIRIDQGLENLLNEKKKVDYSNYADLKDLAKRIHEDEKAPAMAIATWKDGKLEVGVDGLRQVGDTTSVTESDRWLVGSIGKSMTSTMVATLIDEGKLNWDSTLGDILKDVPMKAAYKQVTVEQLMRHRGGIPQDMNFTGATVARIAGTLTDPTAIRASYVKDILSREPIGKPDQRMAYSNAGYAILGYIAEYVTKRPYEQLMKERVFQPIGMSSAICGMPGAEGMPSSKGQPHGHFPSKDGPKPGKLGGPLTRMAAPAGGGIACSIGDLAKFAAWHLKGFLGETVPGLSTKSIQRLHTPPDTESSLERYAAGWQMDTEATPSEMHTHNGSDGTFRAEMAFWPKEKLVVVAIVNVGGESGPTPGEIAVRTVYKKLVGGR
jgi:CubicO group peptidase (beta-lactamase class C family)